MGHDQHTHQDPTDAPHDVLAAEEYGVPAPDPKLHHERPHDVLSAEEYGVPAPDPALHHGPVTLPDDPTGIAEPHDVLAAEEFALPAGHHHGDYEGEPPLDWRRTRIAAAVAVGIAGALLLRRRHR